MAEKTYKVVVVGMGKRGKNHALMFKANPRFDIPPPLRYSSPYN